MANQVLQSSIMRKVAMGLSGIFLISFLMLHVSLNFTSVLSEDLFNQVSNFMSYNWLVQYIGQPILIFGVVFHFVMGFILEIQNRRARPVGYAYNASSANST